MQHERRLTVRKRQTRYYKKKFIGQLAKKGIIVSQRSRYGKRKERICIIDKNSAKENKLKILTLNEKQFLNYIKRLSINQQSLPIIITLDHPLTFKYPPKVIIRISRNKNLKNQEMDQISYSKDDEVIYLQVEKKEFLSKKYWQQNKLMKKDKEQFSISVPQMQLDEGYYSQPKFVREYFSQRHKSLYSVNLWHYIRHTKTKLHYDAHDNFLFQLKGIKKLYLRPPNLVNSSVDIKSNNFNSQTKSQKQSQQSPRKQYIACHNVFGINSNHAIQSVNNAHLNQQNHQFNNSSYQIQLKQNQCLFIPRGWFHQVQSLPNQQNDNVAINFWGNTIETYSLPPQHLQINFKQLIFRISEQICALNVTNWQNLQEGIKEQYRKAYFYYYLNKLTHQPKL